MIRTKADVLLDEISPEECPDAADFRERFDPQPWPGTEHEAWLVIEPFAISGRRLRAEELEWALHPRAYL